MVAQNGRASALSGHDALLRVQLRGAAPIAHTIRDARHKPPEHDRPEEDVGKFGRGLGLGLMLSVAIWIAMGAIFWPWW